MPSGPQIFLAHAREDTTQVRTLYHDLKARGFDAWLDEVDLIPGQNWATEIPKAIRQADVFLACLSKRSVRKRGYVQNEFRIALSELGERPSGTIYLIPVRLDDCDVPDLQFPDRGLSYKDIHWVDLWREDGFEKLVKAIERALVGEISLSPTEASADRKKNGTAQISLEAAAAASIEYFITKDQRFYYKRLDRIKDILDRGDLPASVKSRYLYNEALEFFVPPLDKDDVDHYLRNRGLPPIR